MNRVTVSANIIDCIDFFFILLALRAIGLHAKPSTISGIIIVKMKIFFLVWVWHSFWIVFAYILWCALVRTFHAEYFWGVRWSVLSERCKQIWSSLYVTSIRSNASNKFLFALFYRCDLFMIAADFYFFFYPSSAASFLHFGKCFCHDFHIHMAPYQNQKMWRKIGWKA